jgi:bifunctional non-homologous end joining protein LigD
VKIEVDGRQVEISNPDKLMFPASGITKGNLAAYYQRIGETMLPHVRGRAVTMHRFPDGISGEGFYQKDLPDYFPDWIERASLPKQGQGEVDYLVIEEPASLVFIANQGSITPHVTLSRVDEPDLPDRMVFDMDPPDDGEDLAALRRGVRMVRSVLEELDLESYLMTTGSRGYHLLVPLDRSIGFDETRAFARQVGELAAKRHPESLTVEQRKTARQGRVFVDYLRNSFGQTTVAPYAVRALPGAPIATPLDWGELVSSEPQQYRIDNIFRRLAQKEDPWVGLATRDGHDLSARLDALDSLESES